MKTTIITAGILLATAPVLGIAAAGAANATTPHELRPVGNDKNYSITQTVTNDSNQTLQLTSIRADNGGTVQPGYPTSIAPNGGTAPYVATNHGNGVQLWITFTGSNGAKVSVDSDTPKVFSNSTTGTVIADGATAGNIFIGGGNNPTATFTVSGHATFGTQTTTSQDPYEPPITDRTVS